MKTLVIIYANNRSPHLKQNDLDAFTKKGFLVTTLTAKQFLKKKPEADILWPYFRDIPSKKEDVLAHIENSAHYQTTHIINDYRTYGDVRPADKAASYELVRNHNVQVPRTFRVQSIGDVWRYAHTLSFPFVLKAYPSGQGKDVHLCKNIFHTYYLYFKKLLKKKSVLVQEAIPTSMGTDLRVTFIKAKPVLAVQRTSQKDFRANAAYGASCNLYTLTAKQLATVKKIGEMSCFDIVGVDFLFAKDGDLMFNEFNNAPGMSPFSEEIVNALHAVLK
ncbi:MAG: RimK family alpha-L-glutamate ligase [Patescibacteria group bacterium UBA2163]